MATSWLNEIEEFQVSIALQHLLFAPEGTALTPGRIDVGSPPAGFIHLGAVVDDQPNLAIAKTKYQLQTGIPRVLVYEAVVGIAGEVSTVFHSHNSLHAYMGLGGPKPQNQTIDAHTLYPSVTADTLTPTRTAVEVDTLTDFAVGQLVVTATSAAIFTSHNTAFISSIPGGSSQDIYLSGEGFPFVPVVGEPIYAVGRQDLALGTNVIPYIRLLGVADFLNGAQVIHDFQRATPRGQWQEALQTTQDARMPAMFDLFGYTTSSYGGVDQRVVGERYYIYGTTVA